MIQRNNSMQLTKTIRIPLTRKQFEYKPKQKNIDIYLSYLANDLRNVSQFIDWCLSASVLRVIVQILKHTTLLNTRTLQAEKPKSIAVFLCSKAEETEENQHCFVECA